MIRWTRSPCPDGEESFTEDAVRLYAQMWSAERIARLFGTNHEAMRRLLARHAELRASDRSHPPT